MSKKDEVYDFGFSAVDENEFLAYERNQHKTVVETEVKSKLRQVEDLILPLLNNLLKNPEKIYIKWPNREKIVQTQINKILAITRSDE